MSEVKILNLSYGNFVSLEDYEKLQQQLKQRDEVIDEAIEFINHAQYDPELKSHVCGINFGGTMRLLDILQRYKGDNNEKI